MRVDVSMDPDNEFHASGYWAKKPEYVLTALRLQLEGAQAVWPELKDYVVVKKRERKAKAKP